MRQVGPVFVTLNRAMDTVAAFVTEAGITVTPVVVQAFGWPDAGLEADEPGGFPERGVAGALDVGDAPAAGDGTAAVGVDSGIGLSDAGGAEGPPN